MSLDNRLTAIVTKIAADVKLLRSTKIEFVPVSQTELNNLTAEQKSDATKIYGLKRVV